MQVNVEISRRDDNYYSLHIVEISYEFYPEGNHDSCRMALKSHIAGTYYADEVDMFQCLIAIRQQLKVNGWYILCKGASRNFHPTATSRNMTGGYIVHRIEMGKPATRESKAKIFEPEILDNVVDVDEQFKIYQEWVLSIQQGT
jgi:hypothetical protein